MRLPTLVRQQVLLSRKVSQPVLILYLDEAE
jgi:hypothetical protein